MSMLKYENNFFNVLAYNVFRIALLFRDLLLDFPAVFSVSLLSILRFIRTSDKACRCGV